MTSASTCSEKLPYSVDEAAERLGVHNRCTQDVAIRANTQRIYSVSKTRQTSCGFSEADLQAISDGQTQD